MEQHEYDSELWHPKHEHIELAGGYYMELVAAVENRVYLEGLLCTEHLRERWHLCNFDTFGCLGEWEFDGDHDAEAIWQTLGSYIADIISNFEMYNDIRLAWFSAFPETRREALAERAKLIYESGNALEYICESCGRIHVGDATAIACMILSYAATRVYNSDGIHVSLSGSAGTGKSHCGKTAADHLPDGAVMSARVSDKALFYHDIKSGTVLLMDDQELTEDFQELLKVASTDWNKPAEYLTVNNQKALKLSLPARCPFWVVKANLNGDEQVLDRQLVIWTDESYEQLRSIQNAIFSAAACPEKTAEQESVLISREIWQHISPATVLIPWSSDIECSEHMDARNIKLLIALIQAHALMAGAKRVKNTEGHIIADRDDFKAAARLMNPLLQNKGGSQKLKLSSAASSLLDFLKGEPSGDIPFDDVRKFTKMSKAVLSQALYGRNDTQTEGLLAVCPAADVVDVSVTATLNNGVTRSSRQKAIRWSKEAYDRWLESAGIFALKSVNSSDSKHEPVN